MFLRYNLEAIIVRTRTHLLGVPISHVRNFRILANAIRFTYPGTGT